MVWHNLRPIFNRLPIVYREPNDGDNPSNWLTDFWDDFYVDIKEVAEAFFERHIDPATAETENLDWAATTIYGYLGEYWNPLWSDNVKRQLMTDAYPYLWVERGTQGVIEYLLDLHQVPTFPEAGKIWFVPPLYAGVNTIVPCQVAYAPFQFDIRLDSFEERTAPAWVESYRVTELYTPIWSLPIVGHKYWYVGLSRAGEGVYDWEYEVLAFPQQEETVSPLDAYFDNTPEEDYSPLSALQWLIGKALENNSIGGNVSATVYELPLAIAGDTCVPFLVAEEPNYYVLFPPEVNVGDPDWQVALSVAQLYAPTGSTYVGHDGDYAGIALLENPILNTPLAGTFREVIVTVVDGVPSFAFVEPSFDYPGSEVYQAMEVWENSAPTLSFRDNSFARLQWLYDDRELNEIVLDPAEFMAGVTPVPSWVLASGQHLPFRVQSPYSGTELTSEEWEGGVEIALRGDGGQPVYFGYDGVYAGVSLVENCVWHDPVENPKYYRTVSVDESTLTVTITESFNSDPYADRSLFEQLAAFWDENVGQDPLGATQYLVDNNVSEPATVYHLELVTVGVTTIPCAVGDPGQPLLYVVFPDSSVEYTVNPHPEGSTNLIYYY